MHVNKFIMALTAALLVYMSGTAYFGINNGVDLFIDHGAALVYLRLGLVGALALLYFTEVPRSIATRFFVGIVAAALFIANSFFVLEGSLAPLDGMVFGVVAIILGIEALEYEPETRSNAKSRLTDTV